MGFKSFKPILRSNNKKTERKIDIISHPAALMPKYFEAKPIGMNHRQDEIEYFFRKVCTIEPLKLSNNITFLGQIPRINKFEAQNPVGHTHDADGKLIDDYVLDDSALVIKTKKRANHYYGMFTCRNLQYYRIR